MANRANLLAVVGERDRRLAKRRLIRLNGRAACGLVACVIRNTVLRVSRFR